MICANCEKELDNCECGYYSNCECGYCSNCGGIDKLDHLDRNGYCEQCQEWRCETCGLDLEDCDCGN